jgi:hypothetical protein
LDSADCPFLGAPKSVSSFHIRLGFHCFVSFHLVRSQTDAETANVPGNYFQIFFRPAHPAHSIDELPPPERGQSAARLAILARRSAASEWMGRGDRAAGGSTHGRQLSAYSSEFGPEEQLWACYVAGVLYESATPALSIANANWK